MSGALGDACVCVCVCVCWGARGATTKEIIDSESEYEYEDRVTVVIK